MSARARCGCSRKGSRSKGTRSFLPTRKFGWGTPTQFCIRWSGRPLTCSSRFRRRMRSAAKILWAATFFMGMFMVTMFFGGGLVPTYLLVKGLGLMNSMWAIILPSAASIWNIIVSRTFFQTSIPKELQEAAQIDGCTNMRMFLKIILPLSMPIVAVMALFYGVGNWNSYFSALIYLHEESKYPLQLILRQILVLQEMSAQTGGSLDASTASALNNKAEIAALVKYAVIIVSTLPIIAIYPFLQRYFVQGVMIGSVKG
ncbi:ABC transporter, permease protein [Paenibacillus sp. HGF7]|nr:ABC transporter, permease protein [Paenibacillus sp. HGF7]